MVNKGASDLHLTVTNPPVFRIDGKLVPQKDLPPMTVKDIEKIFQSLFENIYFAFCLYINQVIGEKQGNF